MHKVVINGVNRPYLKNKFYKEKYGNFRGQHDQTPIRDSREEKYYVNRNHPQHAQWQKEHPGNNGHGNNGHGNKGGNGHGKGKDKH
jgi:hypothetical protein